MKPGDFFLGVLDFFAILLPGSLAAWLVTRYVPAPALKAAVTFEFLGRGDDLKPDSLVVAGAFLLVSYVLGNFVFMAGSKLDASYDRWRARVHPRDRDRTYQAASSLRKTLTPELDGGELTVLKWSMAYIQVKAASARPEIDRLEAEQKFFRSLVVIGAIFALHFLLRERALLATAIALVLTAASFRRYLDRRWAMTEMIFATAVIANAADATTELSAKPAREPAQEAG